MNKSNLTLVSASAEGVLGEYNHSVSIDKNEAFIIIYGPNGVGKTKFLEIIHALSQLHGYVLSTLPFKTATLTYSDKSELSVSFKTDKGNDRTPSEHLASMPASPIPEYTLRRPGEEPVTWEHKKDDFTIFLEESDRFEQLSDLYWRNLFDDEVYHVETLYEMYGHRPRQGQQSSPPDSVKDFIDRTSSYLIETQRLRAEQDTATPQRMRFDGPRPRPSRSRINKQAEKIRSLLREAQTEHSQITQQLDRTFPNRVLEAGIRNDESNDLKEEDVRAHYNEQNKFRSRLGQVVSVRLNSELSLPEGKLDDWALKLLNQYLEDARRKFEPFVDLLEKIELLEQIINGRLLKKRLRVTADKGLLVERIGSSESIPLELLSSGEQHEIILMIDLLFNVPKGAIVLIDEPEISLHVAWQILFISDVKQIAELVGFKFIVATHSPQIINDQWNHARRLGPEGASFDA